MSPGHEAFHHVLGFSDTATDDLSPIKLIIYGYSSPSDFQIRINAPVLHPVGKERNEAGPGVHGQHCLTRLEDAGGIDFYPSIFQPFDDGHFTPPYRDLDIESWVIQSLIEFHSLIQHQ